MVAAEIRAGYESAKAALNIAKGIGALKTETAVNGAVIDIQRHVLEAQQALSASLQRIDELEKEVVRLKDWSAEKQRYQLKRFFPGSVAYVLKAGMEEGEAPHRLCPDCFHRGNKSFFQPTGEQIRRYTVHRCYSCRAEAAMGQEMPSDAAPDNTSPPAPRIITGDYDPYA